LRSERLLVPQAIIARKSPKPARSRFSIEYKADEQKGRTMAARKNDVIVQLQN